jgi:hypothetical protein
VATDVTTEKVAPTTATEVEAKPAEPEREHEGALYRSRFAIVYGLLALALVGAGVGGWFAFGASSGHKAQRQDTSWAAWSPDAQTPDDAAVQIAKHVAPKYKLPGGQQLVRVIAGKPDVSQIPVGGLVVQNELGFAVEATQLRENNTIMFILCGRAPDCSITPGKPSVQRGRLVRRETLELALRTFKYASAVENIVAVQPVSPTSQERLLVYLKRSDVAPQLEKPLADTLAPKTPLQNRISPRETAMIDRLVGPHLFAFSVQQAPQGDAILVLKQPAA